jgi:predicted dehydrogenase
VRELIRAGRIGSVKAIHSAFMFTVLDPTNVRNQANIGGGSLYDVGCYPLVTARYVFESEPVRVIALVDRDPVLKVDRLTSGILEFAGGRHLVFSSALQLASFQRVTVLGTSGRIELPVPFTPAKDHSCRLVIDSGKEINGSSAETEEFAAVDQYRLQCDTAAEVFLGQAHQEFPIEDAIANMRIIDALYRSGGSGQWEMP